MVRKPCIVANWKMNGSNSMISSFFEVWKSNITELQNLKDIEIIFCPPAIYMQTVAEKLQELDNQFHDKIKIKLGSQNSYCEINGAYTGEISPSMLKENGCQYVILGHSERRHFFMEDDKLIARKFVASYDAGLIPILCVGETQLERAAGEAFEVVSRQLEAVFERASGEMLTQCLIAYEPVWAIGSGHTATPEQAQEVHEHIRYWIRSQNAVASEAIRILYGGSIKPENAVQLFLEPDIDGGLVGGASLDASDFLKICHAAKNECFEQTIAR